MNKLGKKLRSMPLRMLMILCIICSVVIPPSIAFADSLGTPAASLGTWSQATGGTSFSESQSLLTAPQSNEGMPLNPVIRFSFSNGVLNQFESNKAFFHLVRADSPNTNIPLTVSKLNDDANKKNIFVAPVSPLAPGIEYKFIVDSGVTANNGAVLSAPVELIYTTENGGGAAPSYTGAVISGSTLKLAGLPAGGGELQYKVDGNTGTIKDWTSFNYTLSPAVLNVTSSVYESVYHLSDMTVKLRTGNTGGIASRKLSLSMETGKELSFDRGVKVLPLQMNAPDGDDYNAVSVRDALSEPSQNTYVMLNSKQSVYGFSFHLAAGSQKGSAILTLPVQSGGSDINKLGVYRLINGGWVYQESTDRSQAASGVMRVTVSDLPNGDTDAVFGVCSDTFGPEAVSLSVDSKTETSITLLLSALDSTGVAKFLLYKNGAPFASFNKSQIIHDNGYSVLFTDTDVKKGEIYTYQIKYADDLFGNRTDSLAGISSSLGTVQEMADNTKADLESGLLPLGFAPGDSAEQVTQDIKLPLNGRMNDIRIVWTSDRPEVIPNNGNNGQDVPEAIGKVIKPAGADETVVTLTAHIRQGVSGSDLAVYQLPVTVKWLPESPVKLEELDAALERPIVQTLLMQSQILQGKFNGNNDYIPTDFVIDGKGKTFKAGAYFDKSPQFMVSFLSKGSLTLKNAVIDAANKPLESVVSIAQGSVNLENVQFKNTENVSDVVAIDADNRTAEEYLTIPVGVSITNSTFKAAQRAAVSIKQSGRKGGRMPGILISGNTFDGEGKPGYAIYDAGNGYTEILNNTISGYSDPGSAGVYIAEDGRAILSGNTIANSDIGIKASTGATVTDATYASFKVFNNIQNNVVSTSEDAAEAGRLLLGWNQLEASPGNRTVVLTDSSGSVLFEDTKDELTLPNASPLWAVGSTLTISEIGERSALLAWTSATAQSGITGYRIFNGPILLKEVDGNTTNIRIDTLLPGVDYNFRITAKDAQGNWSLTGPSASIQTLPAQPPEWSAESKANVTDVGSNYAVLNWTPAFDRSAIRNYVARLTANGVPYGYYTDTDRTSILLDDSHLIKPNTTYTVTILAQDIDRLYTEGPSVTFTTTDGPVSNWPNSARLYASDVASDSLTLYWDKAVVKPEEQLSLKRYRIYRNGSVITEGNIGDFNAKNMFSEKPDSYYHMTGLSPNTEYTFKVEVLTGNNEWTADGPELKVKTSAYANEAGQTASLYLTDRISKWASSVNDVKLYRYLVTPDSFRLTGEGASLKGSYSVRSEGGAVRIDLDGKALTNPGDYIISIEAAGFPPVHLYQTVRQANNLAVGWTSASASDAGTLKGVAKDKELSLRFSVPVNPATVTADQIKLRKEGSTETLEYIPTVSADGTQVTLRPKAPFEFGGHYAVSVGTGIQSLIGTSLEAGAELNFQVQSFANPRYQMMAGESPIETLVKDSTNKLVISTDYFGDEQSQAKIYVVLRGGRGARETHGGAVLVSGTYTITAEKGKPATVSLDYTLPNTWNGPLYGDIYVWSADDANPEAEPIHFTYNVTE